MKSARHSFFPLLFRGISASHAFPLFSAWIVARKAHDILDRRLTNGGRYYFPDNVQRSRDSALAIRKNDIHKSPWNEANEDKSFRIWNKLLYM